MYGQYCSVLNQDAKCFWPQNHGLQAREHGLSFDNLPLHDVMLKTIVGYWGNAEIILSVSAFVSKCEAAVLIY
jgi:hypothetical protein